MRVVTWAVSGALSAPGASAQVQLVLDFTRLLSYHFRSCQNGEKLVSSLKLKDKKQLKRAKSRSGEEHIPKCLGGTCTHNLCHKEIKGSGEMLQMLRARTGCSSTDPGLIPSIHMVVDYNCLELQPQGAQHPGKQCRYPYRQSIHTRKNEGKF